MLTLVVGSMIQVRTDLVVNRIYGSTRYSPDIASRATVGSLGRVIAIREVRGHNVYDIQFPNIADTAAMSINMFVGGEGAPTEDNTPPATEVVAAVTVVPVPPNIDDLVTGATILIRSDLDVHAPGVYGVGYSMYMHRIVSGKEGIITGWFSRRAGKVNAKFVGPTRTHDFIISLEMIVSVTPPVTEVVSVTEAVVAPHDRSAARAKRIADLLLREAELISAKEVLHAEYLKLAAPAITVEEELAVYVAACSNVRFFPPAGGCIICLIDDPSSVGIKEGKAYPMTGIGFSLCHPSDTFSLVHGKLLAIKRAMNLEPNPNRHSRH